MQPEQTISVQRVFRGKVVGLRVDEVRLPNGRQATREVVEHGEAVVVVPLDEEDNVMLVRQYRYPVGEVLLEVPAGGVDGEESPEESAIRELREETGHTAERLDRLGAFWTTPGFCNEYMHCYLARGLRPSSLEQDYDEAVETVKVPLQRVLGMIWRGEIKDAKSVAALLMVLYRMRQEGASG